MMNSAEPNLTPFPLEPDYNEIYEDDDFFYLHKRSSLPILVTFPFKNMFVETGLHEPTGLMMLRRLVYPRSEYTLEDVQRISKITEDCPFCVQGAKAVYVNKEMLKYLGLQEQDNGDHKMGIFDQYLTDALKNVGISGGDFMEWLKYQHMGGLVASGTNLLWGMTLRPGWASLLSALSGAGAMATSALVPPQPSDMKPGFMGRGWRKLLYNYGLFSLVSAARIHTDSTMGEDPMSLYNEFKREWSMGGPTDALKTILQPKVAEKLNLAGDGWDPIQDIRRNLNLGERLTGTEVAAQAIPIPRDGGRFASLVQIRDA